MDKLQTWTRKPYEVQVKQYQEDKFDEINEWLADTVHKLETMPMGGKPILLVSTNTSICKSMKDKDHYLVKHGTKVKVLTLEQLQAEYEQKD